MTQTPEELEWVEVDGGEGFFVVSCADEPEYTDALVNKWLEELKENRGVKIVTKKAAPGTYIGLNGYKALYDQKTTEVWAMTSYDAQKMAQKFWGVPEKRRHMISVVLCKRSNGDPVTHDTGGL